MSKYKIIALFGKSCAGKDTIQKWIVSNIPKTKEIISCTTRPQRDYEKDGVDYYFLSNNDFGQKILDCTMLEATTFNGQLYGTAIEALDKDKLNIGVFDLNGIECLLEDNRINILPIYIDAPEVERLLRSLKREDNPDCRKICERFLYDEKEFAEIPFDYHFFKNYGKLNKKALNKMKNLILSFLLATLNEND